MTLWGAVHIARLKDAAAMPRQLGCWRPSVVQVSGAVATTMLSLGIAGAIPGCAAPTHSESRLTVGGRHPRDHAKAVLIRNPANVPRPTNRSPRQSSLVVQGSRVASPRIEFKYEMSSPGYTKIATLPISFLRIANRGNLVILLSRELRSGRPLEKFAVTIETRRGKQGFRGVVDPGGKVAIERQPDMPFPNLREAQANVRDIQFEFFRPVPGMGLRDFPPAPIVVRINGTAVFSAAAITSMAEAPTPRQSSRSARRSSSSRYSAF
jgi:hypothetical protein